MTEPTRLIVPSVRPLYDRFTPCAWPLVRITAGLILIPFGWSKLAGPMFNQDIDLFHKLGLEPAEFFTWVVTLLEFFGGILLTIGLFTRIVALMLTVEMLVITFEVMLPRGNGYQLTILWAACFLALACVGGGKFSVDRLIGREF